MDANLPATLAEFEARAKETLSPADWAYLMAGMASAEAGHGNVEAWRRNRLAPRVLRGVARADTSTTALGTPLAAPLFIAPNGRATRYHPDGEAALLTAAAERNVGVLLPSSVAGSIKPLRAMAPHSLAWLQLYMTHDRGFLRERIAMASEAGCRALVLTVDLTPDATRPSPPPIAPAPWETPGRDAAPASFTEAGVDDLAWLCGESTTPVAVKGVLRADDATACIDAGARGIVVSNHGGNQLGSAIATADALPAIVQACSGRAEIYVDGGIRNGEDIFKALAMGARAVMIGRPMSHALAVAGSAGASACVGILQAELERTMLLCGAGAIAHISDDLIAH